MCTRGKECDAVAPLSLSLLLNFARSLCCIGPAEGRIGASEKQRGRREGINNIPTYSVPWVQPFLSNGLLILLQWCLSGADLEHVVSRAYNTVCTKQRAGARQRWKWSRTAAPATINHVHEYIKKNL